MIREYHILPKTTVHIVADSAIRQRADRETASLVPVTYVFRLPHAESRGDSSSSVMVQSTMRPKKLENQEPFYARFYKRRRRH